MPLASLLGEAIDLAAHFDAHWAVSSREPQRPCFSLGESERIHRDLGEEIRELALVIASVQASRSKAQPRPTRAPVDAGQHLLGEMRSTLSFIFGDDVGSDAHAQTRRLEREFSGSLSHDALALALEAYTDLIHDHRQRVAQESNLDLALLEQARSTAQALRQHSANQLTNDSPERSVALRNRLLSLLLTRMRDVRRAARYFFRDEPQLIKLFESVHERTRRRVRRKE